MSHDKEDKPVAVEIAGFFVTNEGIKGINHRPPYIVIEYIDGHSISIPDNQASMSLVLRKLGRMPGTPWDRR